MELLLGGGRKPNSFLSHDLFSPSHAVFGDRLEKQCGTRVGTGKESCSCLVQI